MPYTILDEKSNLQCHPVNHVSNNNDLPESYDHWCNCGRNVMGIAKHLLSGISGPFYEMECIFNTEFNEIKNPRLDKL